jgi:hypothetical protein
MMMVVKEFVINTKTLKTFVYVCVLVLGNKEDGCILRVSFREPESSHHHLHPFFFNFSSLLPFHIHQI